MISVEGLRKEYGDFVAVADSSFSVDEGEIFGLVGPNGAGKTTTLKILAGLVEPTAGTATVAEYDVRNARMRTELGFLPEESPLYEGMTARSYLRFFADLYDVPPETARKRIESTLDDLELDHRDRPLGDVSKGMKRKVAIARSLVNDPDVLIYDEPASGLDPLTTNYVLQFVRELADRGRTVLFSAHNLYHVENVCDRIAVMNEGHIIARGTIPGIRAKYGETRYRVFTTVPVEDSRPVETFASSQNTSETVMSTPEAGESGQSERYEVTVDDMEQVEARRLEAERAGGRVVDIRTEESSLETIFLQLAEGPVSGDPGAVSANDKKAPAEGVHGDDGSGPKFHSEATVEPGGTDTRGASNGAGDGRGEPDTTEEFNE